MLFALQKVGYAETFAVAVGPPRCNQVGHVYVSMTDIERQQENAHNSGQ